MDRMWGKSFVGMLGYRELQSHLEQKRLMQTSYDTDSPDYRILRTIRRTLIFKQFKKKNIFTIFIIRLQSQTKKILSL
jgi:hypothetical protein